MSATKESPIGRVTHGQSRTPLYFRWQSMLQRCHDPNAENYPRYGGAGVVVCERWRTSFAAFLDDMGEPPTPKHQIDRIDGTKGYEPGNCRWATIREQQDNRRNVRRIEFRGETGTLRVMSERYEIPLGTLRSRIDNKWSIERALTTPVNSAISQGLKAGRSRTAQVGA